MTGLQERIDITSLSNEGYGIGILKSGKKCFVEGALPGESVAVTVTKEASRYSFGKAYEFYETSPDRVIPALTEAIPGAALAHLSYSGQLDYKYNKVRDCLIRLAGTGEDEADKILSGIEGSDKTGCYRNHMQYKIEGNIIGQTASDGITIIPFEKEYLEYPVFASVVKETGKVLERYPTRLLTGLVLRASERTKEIMTEFITSDTRSHELVVREMQAFMKSTGLIDNIRKASADYKLEGVMFRISPDKISRRTRSGKRFILEGKNSYEEIFSGKRFTVEAGSFFQVNIPQAEKITKMISEYLEGTDVIWDLYCGTGTLGLSVLPEGGSLIGIESSPEAVNSAQRNAECNYSGQKDRISFILKDCGKTDLSSLIKTGKTKMPGAVIVDPPRKGLDDSLLTQLIHLGSEKLVYVSCDPATMARDLKKLKEAYETVKVTPVDMFPMTQHVECVTLMTRK